MTAWRVRLANKKDRKRLAKFACADPTVDWSREVEHVVRNDLLEWALAEGAKKDDPRLLLVFDVASEDLVGLAAHERVSLGSCEEDKVDATKLYLAAVSKDWQGKSFANGARVSHVVMDAAMTDVTTRRPKRDARVYAVVHKDNVKSIALCRRAGLVHEIKREHPDYVRLVTEHRAPT